MTAEPPQSTILLAYDGSEPCQAALTWLANLRPDRPYRLLVIYSVEAPPLPRGNTTLKMSKTELYAGLMRQSAAEIDKVRSRCLALCQQVGIAGCVEFVDKYETDPGKAIVAMATEQDADAILMGSRGLNRLRRSLLGSVSDYVVHHGHRPVIVVPHNDRSGQQ